MRVIDGFRIGLLLARRGVLFIWFDAGNVVHDRIAGWLARCQAPAGFVVAGMGDQVQRTFVIDDAVRVQL